MTGNRSCGQRSSKRAKQPARSARATVPMWITRTGYANQGSEEDIDNAKIEKTDGVGLFLTTEEYSDQKGTIGEAHKGI